MSTKGDVAKFVVCFVCFSSAVALLIPLGEWDSCSLRSSVLPEGHSALGFAQVAAAVGSCSPYDGERC